MAAGRDDRRPRGPTGEIDDLRATLTSINELLQEQAEARVRAEVHAEEAKKLLDELKRVVLGVDGANGLSHRVTIIEAREKDAGKALVDPRFPQSPPSSPAHDQPPPRDLARREPTEQQALVREREIDAAVGGWAVRTIRRHGLKILTAGGGMGLVLERLAHYLGLLDKH